MSHPFFPQPYYGVRQARTTGPVPEPMGAVTVGIFDDKVNMPSYMLEPAGVSGYYTSGLGQAPGACLPPEDVARLMIDLVIAGLRSGNVRVPDKIGFIPVPAVGGKPVADLVAPAKESLVPIATEGVVFIASKAKEGAHAMHAAFKDWIKRNIRAIASQVLSVFGAAGAVNIIPASEWDNWANEIVRQTPVHNFEPGRTENIPFAQVCTPTAAPAFKYTVARAQYISPSDIIRAAQAMPGYRVAKAQYVSPADIMRTLPAIKAAQEARARAASKTPLLIGAAAIAALMLLR